MRDILFSFGVIVVLAGALVVVPRLARRFAWQAESQRKVIHVVMGLVCLPFPWMFESAMPVLILAAVAMVGLAAVRFNRRLMGAVGGGLHSIGRQSLGEIYFPLAVGVLFLLSQGDPLLYVIPLLLLTLGDTAGAVIGSRYGRHAFKVPGGVKSVEGSLATFVVGFVVVIVPLAIDGRADVMELVLISLILASVATMMEATSGAGLDNVILPLAGYALLDRYLGMPWTALMPRLVFLYGLIIVLFWYRRLTSLNTGGIFGAILFCYCVFAIGGVEWLVAPLVIYARHALSLIRHEELRGAMHDASIVIILAGGALIWLVLSVRGIVSAEVVAIGYSLGFAAHASIIRLRHWRDCVVEDWHGQSVAAMEGAVVFLVSVWVMSGWDNRLGWMVVVCFLALWGMNELFLRWDETLGESGSVRSWIVQALFSFVFSLSALFITV